MPGAPTLPDLDSLDHAALKAIIVAQLAQRETYTAQHQADTAALTSHASEIAHLKLLVAKLRHMLLGVKSEKVLHHIEQLELKLEELETESAAEDTEMATPSAKAPAARPFRRPLPEHLPREIHTHMPDHEACPACGGTLRALGEDVAEMLEYVRACFKVIRHVRPKLSCESCEQIVQAAAPSRPIDRGLAGPGFTCACARRQVCRQLAVVPAVGDLRA
jgi:hypothetical protein